MHYHYGEPGHGKGPHDGIGATIKHGLDMLVLRDKVKLRSAYEVYLAASTHLSEVGKFADPSRKKAFEYSKRIILYMPRKLTRKAPLNTRLKTITGTQKIRSIRIQADGKYLMANLSCSCINCLCDDGGPCRYKAWRTTLYMYFCAETGTEETL